MRLVYQNSRRLFLWISVHQNAQNASFISFRALKNGWSVLSCTKQDTRKSQNVFSRTKIVCVHPNAFNCFFESLCTKCTKIVYVPKRTETRQNTQNVFSCTKMRGMCFLALKRRKVAFVHKNTEVFLGVFVHQMHESCLWALKCAK